MAHIERNNNLLKKSKTLRKNMTKQEKHLWYDFLNTHTFRWYRQRIIADYIVDFYYAKAHLVVELDGSQHYENDAIEYDRIRTETINSFGIDVVRFSNYDVDTNFESVCMEIDKIVKERIK